MKHPTPRYSFLAFELNGLLDQGVSIPIDEAKRLIEDGSLLDRLEEMYKGEPHYFDVSLYDAAERATICAAFESLVSNVDERRKLAVSRNGIALCLAYCIEVMQHPDGFDE